MASERTLEERPWSAAVSPADASDALQAADFVANRLRDLPGRHRHSAVTSGWRPASLAEGEAGLALVSGYFADCFGDQSWETTAHAFLHSAAEDAIQGALLSPGLFNGLAGLGFAASTLSRRGSRYRRLTASVDDALRTHIDELISRSDGTHQTGNFDLVSGLVGIGVYLLQRAEDGNNTESNNTESNNTESKNTDSNSTDSNKTGSNITDQLIAVTRLLIGADSSTRAPYRWWTPPEAMVGGPLHDRFPDGCLNCGLAHGVPGPLAFLAGAWMLGVRSPDHASAISDTVQWLIRQQTRDEWGPNWPLAVPRAPHRGEPAATAGQHEPTRAAWCYGCPGVARALWLAGVALDQQDWRQLAIEAMRSVYRRPAAARQIATPGLCHGTAGLLQISLRFYQDTHDELFAQNVTLLTAELLDQFDARLPYGFQNRERGDDFDNPGLLNGAAGVAATLLGVATDVTPAWDRAFLIA